MCGSFVEVEFCHEGGVTFNCDTNIQHETCQINTAINADSKITCYHFPFLYYVDFNLYL